MPKVPQAAKSCTSLLGQPDSLAACAIFWSVGAEISPCPHKVSKVCAKGLHFCHSLAAMHGSIVLALLADGILATEAKVQKLINLAHKYMWPNFAGIVDCLNANIWKPYIYIYMYTHTDWVSILAYCKAVTDGLRQ